LPWPPKSVILQLPSDLPSKRLVSVVIVSAGAFGSFGPAGAETLGSLGAAGVEGAEALGSFGAGGAGGLDRRHPARVSRPMSRAAHRQLRGVERVANNIGRRKVDLVLACLVIIVFLRA